jgi:hypothetical protein
MDRLSLIIFGGSAGLFGGIAVQIIRDRLEPHALELPRDQGTLAVYGEDWKTIKFMKEE